MIRKATSDVVRHNDPESVPETVYQMAVHKGPRRIPMHHHHRFPLAFVQIVAVPAPQPDEMRIVIIELFQPGREASAGQSEYSRVASIQMTQGL